MTYKIIEDLAEEPVTLEFFKIHSRIDFNTVDDYLNDLISGARKQLEKESQLSFGVKKIRFMGKDIADGHKLMFGEVDTILTEGYTNFGDNLEKGGKKVDIEYTTKGTINETIKIAICRYAAGLYAIREHVRVDNNGNAVNGISLQNEAKEMISAYRNVTLF